MGYNPYRGSGVSFDNAHRKIVKYRQLTIDSFYTNTYKSIISASRYLYFWYINEKQIGSVLRLGDMITEANYSCLIRNNTIIYPKLAKILLAEGILNSKTI